MGTNVDSEVPSNTKSKTTDAYSKGKGFLCDTCPSFSSTTNAQNPPNEPALVAPVSNVDPEAGGLPRAIDLMLSVSLSNEAFMSKILNTANAAMDELFVKATKQEPLWIPKEDGTEKFNEREYRKMFQSDDMGLENSSNESHCANAEVTREFCTVSMLKEDIINMLMNCDLWASNFCNIVSRATSLGTLSSGKENHDGTILMLRAEFHAVSPLIPTRECYLARYCKQLDQYTWGVVDISLENFVYSCSINKFQRKPSGCLITEMPNETGTNVAWVEHCLTDDCTIHHDLKPTVDAGIGFGARYWLSALSRYTKWCNAVTTTRTMLPNFGVSGVAQDGTMNLMWVGERLMRSLFIDMSSLKFGIWMPSTLLDGKGTVIRRSSCKGVSGLPFGDTVSFATSFKLPISPKRVFDYLLHDDNRAKWDVVSFGCNARTLMQVPTTQTRRSDQNYISLLEVSTFGDYNGVYYLQNAYKDGAAAYVAYAPIDGSTLQNLLTGGSPDFVMLLPSGFSILPDRITPLSLESEGCLITAGFHHMDIASPAATEDVNHISTETLEFVQNMVSKTVEALMYDLPGNH